MTPRENLIRAWIHLKIAGLHAGLAVLLVLRDRGVRIEEWLGRKAGR